MQHGSDDDANMKARLAKLASDLQAKREAETAEARRRTEAGPDKSLGRAMSLGFRVLTEFVSAAVVGAFIGWLIDKWLGTTPWLLVLFAGFGVAAGFNNVYRMAAKTPTPREGDEPPRPNTTDGDKPPQT
jgi:ATP synthase protein I